MISVGPVAGPAWVIVKFFRSWSARAERLPLPLVPAPARRSGHWPGLDRRKDAPMNPADISASALPLTSSDLSLFHLFWQAHWLVKTVMIGLIVCSVWVWAIAIDKTFLFRRIRKAAGGFEQAFWSGQLVEELYSSLAAKHCYSTGPLFVAAMREWKRKFESQALSFAGLQMRIEKVMDVAIAREVEHMERRLLVLATVGSAGP